MVVQRAGKARGARYPVLAGQFVDRIGQRHAGQQHHQRRDDHRIEVERADEGRHQSGNHAGQQRGQCLGGFAGGRATVGNHAEQADHQADDTGGGDVQPRQLPHAGHASRAQGERQDRAQLAAPARILVQLPQRGVALGDAHPPVGHFFGDMVGNAELVQVVFTGRQADHAGDITGADGLRRVAEAEDDTGGIRPRFTIQIELAGQCHHRRLQALGRGAIAVQASGDLGNEGHALRVGGLGRGDRVSICGHAP